MNRRPLALAALLTGSVLLTGCASVGVGPPPRPALINHPVFFTLKNPTDAEELIADCNRLLAPIPGITSYYCGVPYETGRPTVDGDYTVGLFVGFDTPEDYEAYVAHPDHLRLVQKWRPRTEILRVHDILDTSR